MRLEGKNTIITGASFGIGAATARRFAKEGARLVLIARSRDALEQLTQELRDQGCEAHYCCADFADAGQVRDSAQFAFDTLGSVDVLINNAGGYHGSPFLKLSLADWRHTLDVHLTSLFMMSQYVAREMVKAEQGTIINMSSTNGLIGEKGGAHYNAAKGAIVLLTKTMAIELAPHKIRVNAVCPGMIRTRITEPVWGNEEVLADWTRNKILLGRVGEPEEVASAFVFLASDDASFITGECMVIDGGQLAH